MSWLSSAGKAINRAVINVGKAEVKAVRDIGHEIGRAADKPVVQTLVAGTLVATGVGAPLVIGATAAVGAAKGLKPGANIGDALREAGQGAAIGAAVTQVPRLLSAGKSAGANIAGVARRAMESERAAAEEADRATRSPLDPNRSSQLRSIAQAFAESPAVVRSKPSITARLATSPQGNGYTYAAAAPAPAAAPVSSSVWLIAGGVVAVVLLLLVLVRSRD